MAIPTSRTKEKANIFIDESKCTGCGLCVGVCKDFGLCIINGKAAIAAKPVFGCIGCGHCMAVCPQEAITIEGRYLSADDLLDLPEKSNISSYEALFYLMQSRRSIRGFKDLPVEEAVLEKVLKAAQTAPMGLPPSDVHAVVFNKKEKLQNFTVDFCAYLEKIKWLVAPWFLALMRPFWGQETSELFQGFIKPCIHLFINSMKKGENLVTYEAPAAIYFYGSPYTDPADPLIAAAYAMLAAEALGLGTCMIGSIHPLIQYGRQAQKLREKYGIRYKSREGIFLIMGYPRVKYHKGIQRTFAAVENI